MSAAPVDRFMAWIASAEGAGLDRTYGDPGNWPSGKVGVGKLIGSKMGISAAAYPTLDIPSLTQSDIETLYRHDYLDKINFTSLPPMVAMITADAAVNQGVSTAAKILQESLNVTADGAIGPRTLAALVARGKDTPALVVEIAARRALRYAQTGGLPEFGLGWFRRLEGVVKFSLETT
jgi:lysozyme family protein